MAKNKTPKQRAYVHEKCGTTTMISGGHFTQITDPFMPCTGTFCCECNTFPSLRDVYWEDTEETVADYRRRLRAKTPIVIKLWRYGLGLVVGAGLGAIVGLLISAMGRGPQNNLGVIGVSAGVGAVLIYLVGTVVLHAIYDLDYRRKR